MAHRHFHGQIGHRSTNGRQNPGFSLVSTSVETGDFQQQVTTWIVPEATVLCTWTNGTTPLNITPDVAEFIGTTLL
ncbi:hypothetical protein B0H14DRAFT_3477479 [Mycena olivaceomarginata]|nr:hypothetical protein B0H14DRAFT_3477479 [Mycena olivaceomarginata]